MEVRVGALDRYGPLGQLWGVLATFVAKNNICCYLKSGGQKMHVFATKWTWVGGAGENTFWGENLCGTR